MTDASTNRQATEPAPTQFTHSTLADTLRSLQPEKPAFPAEYETGVISLLLEEPQFFQETLAHLEPAMFQTLHCKYVMCGVKNLFSKGGVVPSRRILRGYLAHEMTVEDPYQEVIGLVNQEPDPREVPFTRQKLHDFIHTRLSNRLYSDEMIALQNSDPVAFKAELRKIVQDANDFDEATTKTEQEWFTFGELATAYPTLRPVVVENLLREGEIANFVSYSKIGKSWLAYALALSVVTGRPWLGTFPTGKGKVLYIDNELHRETLAYRIAKVADALHIPYEAYRDDLVLWPIRAKPRSLSAIRGDLARRAPPGEFKLINIDAKYRFIEQGASENDNAAETRFYNLLNEYAEMTRAAMGLIHHTTKGIQSDKRITDVGSGAGAQSRAADTHLILREHEDESTVVAEAVVRSFAPVAPLVLRWEFPLWQPVADADPTRLADTTKQKQQARDGQGLQAILDVLGALPEGLWISRSELETRSKIGYKRIDKLCFANPNLVEHQQSNKTHLYKLAPSPVVAPSSG